MNNPDDIVGHNTFHDANGIRHEPLTRAEADGIRARIAERDAKWAADMPDDATAVRALTDAFYRLKQLGWREASYCPKDGSPVDVIEAGSSDIHRAYWRYFKGKEGDGCFWIPHDDGDESPSRPILYRALSREGAVEP